MFGLQKVRYLALLCLCQRVIILAAIRVIYVAGSDSFENYVSVILSGNGYTVTGCLLNTRLCNQIKVYQRSDGTRGGHGTCDAVYGKSGIDGIGMAGSECCQSSPAG